MRRVRPDRGLLAVVEQHPRRHSTCPVAAATRPLSTVAEKPSLTLRRARQLDQSNGPAWRYLDARTGHAGEVAQPPLILHHHSQPSQGSGRVSPHAGDRLSAASSSASGSDPLEELLSLDDPCADGPTMVAMWTSLHRSCLHQSEISESVAFTVRRVFHGLIRNRAFDAATRFYWKLMTLGLSLRSTDIALLFSNLPYEKSVGSSKDLDGDQWLKTDLQPLTWKAKKAMEMDAAQQQCRHTGSNNTPRGAPGTTTATQGASPPRSKSSSSISRRWLERWAVYEAAMGHIDCLGVGAGDAAPALTDASGAGGGEKGPAADVLVRDHASYATALLHHLCFMQRSVGGDTVATRCVTQRNKHTVRVRCCAPYRGYWAEALHVVAQTIQSGVSPQSTKPHVDGALAPLGPVVMEASLAQSAFDALLLSPAKRRWVAGSALLAQVRTTIALEHRIAHVTCASLCADVAPLSIRSAARRRRVASARRLASSRITDDDHSYAATKHAMAAVAWSFDTHCNVDATGVDASNGLQQAMHQLSAASEALFLETCRAKQERQVMLSNIDMQANRGSASVLRANGDMLHRVVPLGLELNMSLFASACGAVSAAVPTLHRIAQITNQPQLLADNVAKDLFLGQNGLFRCYELLYAPEHASHKEYKAALNADERSRVLSSIACASMRWLNGAVARGGGAGRHNSHSASTLAAVLSPLTAAAMLDKCADVVRGIPLAVRRETIQQIAAFTIVRCLDAYDLTCRRSRTTCDGEQASLVDANLPLSRAGCVELMAAIARILVLCCPLERTAMSRCMRNRPNILRSIAKHCSPQTPLGQRVRAALSANTVKLVDQLLLTQLTLGRATAPRRLITHRRAPSATDIHTSLIRRASTLSDATVAGIMQSRKYIDAAYRIATSGSVESNAIQMLQSASNSWVDSLSVMQALLHSVRVRSSALSVQVYGEAIRLLAVPTASRHSSEGGVHNHPTSAAMSSVGDVAWQSAISLFWHAVDHATVPDGNGGAHDRTLMVLDATIGPLLAVCVSAGRYHEGRRWNERWQRLHAEQSPSNVLGSDAFLLAKLGHSVTLQERDALRRLLYFRCTEAASSESPTTLQQSLGPMLVVAATNEARRGRWKEAVELICASHGDERIALHRDASASLAVLSCLHRAGLYRSAMRLQQSMVPAACEGQQPQAPSAWSNEHSLLLLQCLNRARRWRDALSFFASPMLMPQHLRCGTVLIEGLRACAQGGKSEPAVALYDTFKAAQGAVDNNSDSAAPRPSCNEHNMFSNPQSVACDQQHSVGSKQRVHPSEALLAKSLFLRAMTKHLTQRTAQTSHQNEPVFSSS